MDNIFSSEHDWDGANVFICFLEQAGSIIQD